MAQIKSVCVYCGAARDGGSNTTRTLNEKLIQEGYKLGRMIAERKLTLVYGGGRYNMMKAVADGAADQGGAVVGVMPKYLDRVEGLYERCTELIVTDNMHTRKQHFFNRSDAFVVLPGGVGTVEELFEIIKWRQLRFHNKPIVLVNTNQFWQPFVALIDHLINTKLTDAAVRDMFSVVDDVEAVWPVIDSAPEINTGELTIDKL